MTRANLPLGLAGAFLILLAFVVNPLSLQAALDRSSFSDRAVLIIVTAELVLAVAGLALARKLPLFDDVRWQRPLRGFTLRVAILCVPLVFISGVELLLYYYDALYAIEHTRTFRNYQRWPDQLDESRRVRGSHGLLLYRPFHSELVNINELGLRTAPPSPRHPGEWRIALTGGSAVWGWRVADDDSIPKLMEASLRRRGHRNIRVYSVSAEAYRLLDEVRTLAYFQPIYDFDQVVAFTGANDGWEIHRSFLPEGSTHFTPLERKLQQFSMYRLAQALAARFSAAKRSDPSPQQIQAAVETHMRRLVDPALHRLSTLCASAKVPCDIALQPWLFDKSPRVGPEEHILTNSNIFFTSPKPAYEAYYERLVAGAGAGSIGVIDARAAFKGVSDVIFGDLVHINERGNELIAEYLVGALIQRYAHVWQDRELAGE